MPPIPPSELQEELAAWVGVLKYSVCQQNIRGPQIRLPLKRQFVIVIGSKRKSAHHIVGGLHREAPGLVRRQRERRNCGQEPVLWFSQAGVGNAGKQA